MSTAATAEKETSGLTLADVAKKSEMEGLGWSINQADDKTWSAHEKAGDLRDLGPAKSIGALHTQVTIAAGKNGNGAAPKTVKTGKDTNGQPTLKGTEDAVLEDLRSAILDYRDTTMQVLDLQKRQKTQKASAMDLMHKFEDELKIDPETGFKYFQAEMIIAELTITEVEDLKTRAVKNE